jgi:hypothetical protein
MIFNSMLDPAPGCIGSTEEMRLLEEGSPDVQGGYDLYEVLDQNRRC